MATVQSMTLARLLALEADTVIGGHIDVAGDLILEQHDGSTINAGSSIPTVPDASTTVKGKVELATDAEVVTGTDTVRAATPSGVAAAIAAFPAASATVQGKVELATNTEATTGTDTTRAVTPANLAAAVATHVPITSTTVQGKVELATNAEAITGTDTARAVTPSGVAAAIDSRAPGRGEVGTYTCVVGTVAASTASEVAVPSASWSNEPTLALPTGRIFRVHVTLGAYVNAATDSITTLKVRKGAATISGTQLCYWNIPIIGISGLVTTYTFFGYFKNTSGSTVNTKLSLTNGRAAGATTTNLFGDANIVMMMTVEDYGAVSDLPEIDSIAISV